MSSNNGQVKKQQRKKLQSVSIILRDTPEGKFQAEVIETPKAHDHTGAQTKRSKNSPSVAAAKRLCEILVAEFVNQKTDNIIILPR